MSINQTPNTTTCTSLHRTTMGKSCILRRLSEWLWSAWTVSAPGSHAALPESTPHSGRGHNYRWESGPPGAGHTDLNHATPRYLPPIVEEEQGEAPSEDLSAYPCKGCQTWGVTCDRQRPRCSHCLDQQILCFYVAPVRKSPRRSKASTRSRPQEAISG